MPTWSPSYASLVAIRPFACEKKRFEQKFTDRQTDDGRFAIVLAHSWNELKIDGAAAQYQILRYPKILIQLIHVISSKKAIVEKNPSGRSRTAPSNSNGRLFAII